MTDPADEVELAIRAREPLLYLLSWEEERAVEIVSRAAARLGRPLFVWTRARGLSGIRSLHGNAALAEPGALLDHIAGSRDRGVYALLDAAPYLADPVLVRKLKDVVRTVESGEAEANLVFVSPALSLPPELQKETSIVDLPLPNTAELGLALDGFISQGRDARRPTLTMAAAQREALVHAAQGLTLKEFASAVARSLAAGQNEVSAAMREVLRAKSQAIRKTGFLYAIEPDRGLDTVGGLDALKQWLDVRRATFGEAARDFGVPAPRGLLLVGVQGAGKSLCARATAAHWNMPLLRLDLAALYEGIVGQSEANVRRALDVAGSVSPCVLWIDEIEKGLAGATGAASDAGTAARVVGWVLTWLQERATPVFVVATANDVTSLPPELLRRGRFDEIFFLDLPAALERLEIMTIHLRRRGRDPDEFDLAAFAEASEGFSGAEIEQVVIDALVHAFAAQRPLEQADLVRALHASVPLARTAREQVSVLRSWAQRRARPASLAAAAAGRIVSV